MPYVICDHCGVDCDAANTRTVRVLGHRANYVKLHPCDIAAITGSAIADQVEGLNLIPYCDAATGSITGYGAAYLAEDGSGTITVQYFDSSLSPVGVPPAGAPCQGDYEYKWVERCFREIADNTVVHTRLTCVAFLNGVRQTETELWVLDNGTVSTTAPVGIEPCPEDQLATSVDATLVSDFTIPSGFIHGSILIESGTADINGEARTAGFQLGLPPMGGVGGRLITYPAYPIENITGTVLINYHTL